MPKLLQIDTCLNNGSTGRITESIARLAIADGWECYIMHSARYATPPSVMSSYQIGTKFHEYLHYFEGLFLDNHGLCSTSDTKRAIKEIERIKPDVIHLHCIHGYFLNYKILFEYLNSTNIPIVWTFHDCWAFTGHCAYFDSISCNQWKSECINCPLHTEYPMSFVDRCRINFNRKKRLFTSIENLTLVPVSSWLNDLIAESFMGQIPRRVIHNGTDISIFKPIQDNDIKYKYQIKEKYVILGVASPWIVRKGLRDFTEMSNLLGDNYKILLVGLNDKQISELPKGIIGIKRTTSTKELAKLYSAADVYVNPTYSDNFPTTNIEALACGTPVITYNTGGSPEAIDNKTGIIVEQGHVQGLIYAINQLKTSPLSSDDCRNRAVQLYDMNYRFKDYINLYNELISN